MSDKRITIIVQPQSDDGREYIDIGKEIVVDASAALQADSELREMVADESIEDWEVAERLIEFLDDHGAAPAEMDCFRAEWSLPFDEVDERVSWLEAHPLWTPGCGSAHPFGGYVDVIEEVDEATGERTTVHLDRQGRRHRTDGPATIIEHQGRVTRMWVRRGRLSRAEGPSITTVDEDGALVAFTFTDALGRLHNDNGPAIMDGDGLSWYVRGELTATCPQPTSAKTGRKVPLGSADAPFGLA